MNKGLILTFYMSILSKSIKWRGQVLECLSCFFLVVIKQHYSAYTLFWAVSAPIISHSALGFMPIAISGNDLSNYCGLKPEYIILYL